MIAQVLTAAIVKNGVRLGNLIAYSVGMLNTPKNTLLLILLTYLHISVA